MAHPHDGRYGDAAHALLADGPPAVLSREELLDQLRGELGLGAGALASEASTSWPLADRDADWDGSAAEGRIREWAGVDGDDPSDAAWGKYGSCHFWTDPDAADKFGGYKLPFCDVVDGKVVAVPKGVFGAAGAVQGSRGGVKLPSGDVAGVKAKIESYYKAMAKKFDDDSIEAPWADESQAAHPLSSLSETDRRKVDADNEITDGEALDGLVASMLDARGGPSAVLAARWAKGITAAVGPDGTVSPAPWHAHLCVEGIRTDDHREFVYGCFQVGDLPQSLRLLIEDEGGHWGAVTCGRIDSITPVDIVADESRFYDAAGMFGSDPNGQLAELMVAEQTQRFISADPRGDVQAEWVEIIGGSSAVAIDGEVIPIGNDAYDCWWRFTNYPLAGGTIVPIPAFPQCTITLADVPLPDAPIAMETAPDGLPENVVAVTVIEDDDDDDDDDGVVVVVNNMAAGSCHCVSDGCACLASTCADGCSASCGCGCTANAAIAAAVSAPAATEVLPRAEWFDRPALTMSDRRLVLQADGESYAVPLWVGDPDTETGLRPLFAHFAWWNCDHTGFPGEHVKPPHSASGYAYFNLGQGVDCLGGQRVSGVGRITMGCGHAPLRNAAGKTLSPNEVTAHYDGGYGAITAAYVRAGEDEFGPWVAGYVNPQLSETELRDFCTLNLSGDWREIADNLETLAVLAVPVPGFPVKRAMTAAGVPELFDYDTRAAFLGDRPTALVAAGIVRRVSPEARLAMLEQGRREDRAEIAVLKALVASMRREQYRI